MSDFITIADLREQGWEITETSIARVKVGAWGSLVYSLIVRDDASGWGSTGPAYPTKTEALANVPRVNAEYYGDVAPAAPPVGATVTVADLRARADTVIDHARETGKPVAITRHGRFVAMVVPLDDAAVMRAALTSGPIAEEIARRVADLDGETFTSDQVAEEIERGQA